MATRKSGEADKTRYGARPHLLSKVRCDCVWRLGPAPAHEKSPVLVDWGLNEDFRAFAGDDITQASIDVICCEARAGDPPNNRHAQSRADGVGVEDQYADWWEVLVDGS
jgi:hypothetical protein